ncbi:5-formyltetrahydrofolate cyclo-ligase [Archaeoglobus profundus]|uniref:5-formyltetrahydrofolate cyclo-ligase n=1 Tax=Archaeoglobus profundus (strain DSM 5631 / JCM 9629 / NBRC 100127 / Av18) TaxID=572546 RepID=D2RDE9_ARCPA|nr:5-formyltetrahydrofolate cyclo-ligase [Archaeoglobus profundus]ADB58143.1 5-formyltetrahydrofolate cyclo-ligase [Archaeoglobus profundus DSM 5631]
MKSKQEVREYVWNAIKPYSTFPPPYGRIPNFVGADKACEKLRELEEYRKAKVVFSAPDSPLKRAREIVLEDGKKLLVVKPKMTGFLLVENGKAGTIKEMLRYGREVDLNELKIHVDIFLQGCVAVDRKGNRIGKGSGFGDREYRILREKGLIDDETLYVVVAHPIQIFDDLSHLMDEHDVKVDVILTPKEIIRTENYFKRFR